MVQRKNSAPLTAAARRAAIHQRLAELRGAPESEATASLNHVIPSPDGRWLAQGTLDTDKDLLTWTIRSTRPTAQDELSEQIHDCYPSGIAWKPNGEGFYYDRMLPFAGGHALYYHACGTSQRADTCLLYEPTRPAWYYQPHVSPDGRWLAVTILHSRALANLLWVKPLTPIPPADYIQLIPRFVGRYDVVLWQDNRLIVRAITPNALNGQLIAFPLPGGEPEVILPANDYPLRAATVVGDSLVVASLDHRAVDQLHHYQPNQPPTLIPLPGLGTLRSLSVDPAARQIQFVYTDYTHPPHLYRWRVGDSRPQPVGEPPNLPFDPADFVTQTAEVESSEETVVSIFLAHRRTLPLNQPRPTLLTAYGGLGVALTPQFAPDVLAWLEMGGRFVSVCARGGGERGEGWHRAAVGAHKQRTFDDVLAVARWLIAHGVTTPDQLGLWGASNGGLTAGACLTQAPDLFGAVVIEAGLLDMLDYHHLGQGANWLAEYGSPDHPSARVALAAYSPLHNLTPRAYPATLITTSAHDPRVGEAHSLRFAHALRAAQTGSAPITLRVYPDSGHGDALRGAEALNRAADRIAFLACHLGITP